LKIKEVSGILYRNLGLRLVNTLARRGNYQLRQNIDYGNKGRNRLDYYLADGDPDRPTVLFFYGGNWRSGEKADYRFVADTLACNGFNVIIPDYRQYPEVRFSTIQEDTVNATKWALDNLPENQKLYLMGHSSGAQLGALICLNDSLLCCPSDRQQPIHGFIGLAGPYDFFPFTEDDHWDLFSPEERYPESQPVNYVSANAPPMYLLHGQDDTRVRRGHSKSLMEKIQAAGGHAKREVYANTDHVGILLSFTQLHRRGSPVVKDVVEFLSDRSN